MSSPTARPPSSMSTTGYADGLGWRTLRLDRDAGRLIERLHPRPELRLFETQIRETAGRVASIGNRHIARPLDVTRIGSGPAFVESELPPGVRLSDLIEIRPEDYPAAGLDAALHFLGQTLQALAALHAAGLAHGALAPGRIIVTPAGHVVLLDAIFAASLERLRLNRRTLWRTLGILAPPTSSPLRLDAGLDVSQAAFCALQLALGRGLAKGQIDELPGCLQEVAEVAQIRGGPRFAASLDLLLRAALAVDGTPPIQAGVAANEVQQLSVQLGSDAGALAELACCQPSAEPPARRRPPVKRVAHVERPQVETPARIPAAVVVSRVDAPPILPEPAVLDVSIQPSPPAALGQFEAEPARPAPPEPTEPPAVKRIPEPVPADPVCEAEPEPVLPALATPAPPVPSFDAPAPAVPVFDAPAPLMPVFVPPQAPVVPPPPLAVVPPPEPPRVAMPVFAPVAIQAPVQAALAPVATVVIATTSGVRLKPEASPRASRGALYGDTGDSFERALPYVHRPPSEGRRLRWKPAATAIAILTIGVLTSRPYVQSSTAGRAAEENAPEVVTTPIPPATTGSLYIESQPAGAKVLVDGTEVGTTPLRLEQVAAGRHVVTISTGTATVRRSVKVEGGRELTLDVPVYSGWVAVFAPIRLQVSAAGKNLGSTDSPRIMLPPGRHVLTLRNRDLGFSMTQAVDIVPGEEHVLNLQPTGVVNVNAVPWAEVWVDGSRVGETPIARLPALLGMREFLFKHPLYGERRVTATVTTTASSVSVDFTRPSEQR